MRTQRLAGSLSGLSSTTARLIVQRWRRRVAVSMKSISAAPFGESLSEEEFAFCLLLIAAHL